MQKSLGLSSPGLVNLRKIFPDKFSIAICLGYILAFVLQGLLTKASVTKDGDYEYNTTANVVLCEVIKLTIAVIYNVYQDFQMNHRDVPGTDDYKPVALQENSLNVCHDGTVINKKSWIQLVKENKSLFLYYMIPSFLYSVYNNLTFTNLKTFDPATYYLLLQFRVVVTAITFQVLFDKRLSTPQWASLSTVTLGCIVQQLPTLMVRSKESSGAVSGDDTYVFDRILILIQVFCSCFAGVYNEKLLKVRGKDLPVMVQNVFMYVDSIFCNLLIIALRGNLSDVLELSNYSVIIGIPLVFGIAVNNACIGLITSMFLRKLNSIVKIFASAFELVLTAYLSWLFFDIPVNMFTNIALALICLSIVIYGRFPVIVEAAVHNRSSKGNGLV